MSGSMNLKTNTTESLRDMKAHKLLATILMNSTFIIKGIL